MSKVIGIDLGTTNSVVAIFEDGQPRILPNASGELTTPSMVALTDDGRWLVGHAARNQQVTNPANTIYSMKCFVGRRHHEVASEEKIVPYRVLGKPNEFVKIGVGRRKVTPQELSGMLIRELKEVAERHLGEPVERAVITVPAYFNDSQRQATKDGGEIAGLEVERIINEPTAAALAYGLEKKGSARIVIFDFGGGTFDLSIMDFNHNRFKVLGVHGDTHLGGDDFDQRIIDIVAEEFRRKTLIDLRDQPMALQRLKEASEQAKTELSYRDETEILLPFICVDGGGPKHLEHRIKRETFEAVCADLFESLRQTCGELLLDTRVVANDIDEVVLVGGSTRMPMAQTIAREVYRTDRLNKSINPDEVVALGAAVLGGVLQGDLFNVDLMDVTSHSFGVETARGGVSSIVPKNTPIPTSVKRLFSTPRDYQTSVPINVLEGESDSAEENRALGVFQLRGIPKVPAGVPKIEVEFAIDSNGILQVSATDQDTGRSQKIVITGGSGLETTEMQRMKRDVEQHVTEEAEHRQMLDLRNHAETVHHDVSKWLEYNGHLMPDRAQKMVAAVLKKLEKRIRRKDLSGIRVLLKRLDEVVQPLRRAG